MAHKRGRLLYSYRVSVRFRQVLKKTSKVNWLDNISIFSGYITEITGFEGQHLVIPCKAPKDLQFATIDWTFTKANETTDVLKYDSRTHKTTSFQDYGKLKDERALKGDGSLTLENPVESDHSGIYTCVFSGETTRHLIETSVDVTLPRQKKGIPWSVKSSIH